jgi:RND family efflux transporter MFP subunit
MSDSTSTKAQRVRRRGRRAGRVVVATVLGVAQFVLVVALIGGGIFAAFWFNNTPATTAQSIQAREEASRLVVVDVAERASRPVVIRTNGTVMPAREAVLRPRVAGMIVEQDEAFVPGGFFSSGSFLVQIDRADYEQALLQRESDLARAEAALQIELGDQAIAEEELELLGVDVPQINRDLILRIPQVNRAKAEVRSAEAAIRRAELDLERTRIVAPFDGYIVDRSVTIGNNVSAGDALATFVGSERYWIEVTVPVSSLRWISAPADAAGSPVTIRHARAWGSAGVREGHVMRRIGRLEQGSRLARVLINVPDPLAKQAANANKPSVLLGAYVDVEIQGREIDDVIVVDRDVVREGDVVWVMGSDDRLVIKPIDIAYRGREQVYVAGGLEHGDRVVRTNLTAPVAGMLLRVEPAAPPPEALSDG